jgi:hypothetical protein
MSYVGNPDIMIDIDIDVIGPDAFRPVMDAWAVFNHSLLHFGLGHLRPIL